MSQFQEKQRRIHILKAARKIFGRLGYREATMDSVAKSAGVSKGLLHYYFRSKEGLLIETQKAVFRELHRRFTTEATKGEQGLHTALSALDAMWQTTRELRDIAPFMVETLNLGNKKSSLQPQIEQFYRESTSLLEDGIRKVFAKDVGYLQIPPDRMAILIRIFLSGMVIELAQVKNTSQLKELDQVYADIRSLFEKYILEQESSSWNEDTDSVPLPW